MKKLPEGWRMCAIKDVVDPIRKVTYGIVQPGVFTKGGTLLVRGQDYSFGWAAPDNMFRVSDKIETPYRRSRLKTGDIVITIVGAGTGTTAIVPPIFDGANITQTTARIAVAPDKANRRYVYQYLNSRFAAREVYHYIKGGAQPGLNIEDVERFKVILPTDPEQEQMADMLDGWDNRLVITKNALESAGDYANCLSIQEAWEMLLHLNQTMYQLKFEDDSPKDLEKAFKEKSGYDLALSEGKLTQKDKKLMRLRILIHDGKEYDITPHLKYHNNEPKSVRIYFAFDERARKIIVGHIGRHIPNATTKTL
jgi:hypothetical protein